MIAARHAVIVASLVALAGCSDGDDTGGAGPSASTSTTVVAIEGLDFGSGSAVDLGGGWEVSPCESGPPLFCARLDGATQATIDLLSAPVASFPAVAAALDGGAAVADALEPYVREFHDSFESDRGAGCGAAYAVEPFGPDAVTVAGHPGVRYGFEGSQDGRVVERAVVFATVVDGTVHIIGTSAIDDGTCMDDGEHLEFTVTELDELQATIERVVAVSTLP